MCRLASFMGLGLVLMACAGAGQILDVPNPTLTPGQLASTDDAEVCVPGYSRAHRHTTNQERAQVYREYGVPRGVGGMVIDHLVPIALGGADALANLWPEPEVSAAEKDRLEGHLYMLVCVRRSMPLRDAQAMFLAPADWRASYQSVFGEPP